MDPLIALLSHPIFQLLGEDVTVLEGVGFLTGALCVWAVSMQWLWNWPVGLLNNAAFFVLFVGVGLYADATLQVAFFALGVYGWIVWTRRQRRDSLLVRTPIRRVGRVEGTIVLAATAVGTVTGALLLTTHTDSSVPWPDAFVLSGSLAATWGQARKIFEQWWMWIAVDVISIPLYLIKGLALTAILYLGFLALCVFGVARWQADLRRQAGELVRPVEVAAP